MTRKPGIPAELTRGPFSLTEARKAGLTLSSLRGKAWTRLGAELYCWAGFRQDHWLLLSTLHRTLPPAVVFAGATAAWMLGLDFEPANPVAVVLPLDSSVRSRDGLISRRCDLAPNETVTVRGMRATELHRTLRDLCFLWPEVEALVAMDMALHRGLTDLVSLWRHASEVRGPGSGRMRALAVFSEPAESPMETRLRWLLIRSGLPRPQVQVDLRDEQGAFLGRADLYYRGPRLVIEYDGGNHRERLESDNRRQNLLIDAGYKVLRFTAGDLRERPQTVIEQVAGALVTDPSIPHVWRQTRAKRRTKAHGWRQRGGIQTSA